MAEQTLATPAKKWAREYETIYILRPTVEAEDARKVSDRVTEVMNRMSGKITKVETWGMRRLAYVIDKHSRGIFVYVRYAAFGDVVAELERNLRLLDTVIRFQTIRVRDNVEMEEVEVDPEETKFDAIERGEDEVEPTTAERLGMAEREERSSRDERSNDDKGSDDDDKGSDDDEDDDASAKGDSSDDSSDEEGEDDK